MDMWDPLQAQQRWLSIVVLHTGLYKGVRRGNLQEHWEQD